jgi:hypothetical protein
MIILRDKAFADISITVNGEISLILIFVLQEEKNSMAVKVGLKCFRTNYSGWYLDAVIILRCPKKKKKKKKKK